MTRHMICCRILRSEGTLEEFRLLHSELIEHYQFIEYRLEVIYACLCEGKSFSDGLMDVEKDTIRRLLNKIRTIQKARGKVILTEEECKRIERICGQRNIWCHNCYVELVFDSKTGVLKKSCDIKKMMQDLTEAKEIRDWLFKKSIPLIESKRGEVL